MGEALFPPPRLLLIAFFLWQSHRVDAATAFPLRRAEGARDHVAKFNFESAQFRSLALASARPASVREIGARFQSGGGSR
jgi:hypothetical protein